MNMRITMTKEIPTEGQFIAIWTYDNKSWCATHKWKDEVLIKYIDGDDDWRDSPHDASFYEEIGAEFIILGDVK